MKKETVIIAGLGIILLGLAYLIFFSGLIEPADRISIGETFIYEVTGISGKKYLFNVHTSDGYYVKEGCRASDGSNINACNLNTEYAGTEGGCTLNRVYSSGTWQNCDGAVSRCAYGANCNSGDSTCKRYCDWASKDYGVRGGISYDSRDGCAVYVDMYDMNGTLVYRKSMIEEISGWQSDRPYIPYGIESGEYDGIYFQVPGNSMVTYGSSCALVKGVVRDKMQRTVFCIGTGTSDANSPYCNDTFISKECTLMCDDGYILDSDNCVCTLDPCYNHANNGICQAECNEDITNTPIDCGECTPGQTQQCNPELSSFDKIFYEQSSSMTCTDGYMWPEECPKIKKEMPVGLFILSGIIVAGLIFYIIYRQSKK